MTKTRAHVILYGKDFFWSIQNQNLFWANVISRAGIELVPIDHGIKHPLVVVEHRVTPRLISERQIKRSRSLLVRVEPPSVNPYQYSKKATGLFDIVLTPTKSSALGPHEDVYHLSLLNNTYRKNASLPNFEEWNRRPFDVAMVLRPNVSFVPGSLYYLRGQLLNELADSGLHAVYAGPSWNESHLSRAKKIIAAAAYVLVSRRLPSFRRHPRARKGTNLSYLGKVRSSAEVYRSARFSVIVENEATYVSEKIFDSLSAGCVPIYVGKQFDKNHPFSNFLIQASGSTNNFGPHDLVPDKQSTKEAFQKLQNYMDWLSSEESEFWTVDAYSRRLASKIKKNMRNLIAE